MIPAYAKNNIQLKLIHNSNTVFCG